MRLLGLTALLLVAVTSVAAQSGVNITSCGLSCLVLTAPQVNCSLTDFVCQCKSEALPGLTSTCLLANCTMQDALMMSRSQAILCNLPHEDRSGESLGYGLATFLFTSVLLALRLISKIWVSRSLGADDWFMVVAQAMNLSATVFASKMANQGFGKHIWDLRDGDLLFILKYFYIAENLYVVGIAITKTSVLFLYLRLFELKVWFRYATFAIFGTIAINVAILSGLTIFACSPVPYFWDRDIPGGKCIDVKALAYANGASSLVQDLVIVALPLPVLWGLQMPKKKKLGIGFMLVLGSLGCVVTMIRLKFLVQFNRSDDFPWVNVDPVIWTVLEVAAVMACLSLPSLRVLYLRIFRHQKNPGTTNYVPSSGATPRSKSWKMRSSSRRITPSSSNGFVELDVTLSESQERLAASSPTTAKVPPKNTGSILVEERESS